MGVRRRSIGSKGESDPLIRICALIFPNLKRHFPVMRHQ